MFGKRLLLELINYFDQSIIPPQSNDYFIINEVISKEMDLNVFQFIEYCHFLEDDWHNIYDHSLSDDKGRKMKYFKDVYSNNEIPLFLQDINICLQILFYDHTICGHSILYSLPGLEKQGVHTDYFKKNLLNEEKDIMPYLALIALKDNIKLYNSKYEEILIPKYSMILFSGDFKHAGAEYSENSKSAERIHIYLDSKDHIHDRFSQKFESNKK